MNPYNIAGFPHFFHILSKSLSQITWLQFLQEMCEKVLQGWTRELGAIHWMCRNPTRQAYVALFPHFAPLLHPWASVCIPSLPHSFFFFFFSCVPWLPCGLSVRYVCLSPLAIFFSRQRTEQERGACKAACGNTVTNASFFSHKHFTTHFRAHTHAQMRVCLKKPGVSERRLIWKSGLEYNKNRVCKDKTAGTFAHHVLSHTQFSALNIH